MEHTSGPYTKMLALKTTRRMGESLMGDGLGCEATNNERSAGYALQVNVGGSGLRNPTRCTNTAFPLSRSQHLEISMSAVCQPDHPLHVGVDAQTFI